MADLTDKQKRFCDEYLKDLNGTQAAIRCGYSEKTANEQASRLLANVNIKQYIEERQKELAKAVKIDQEWILQRFIDISNRCMQAVPVMVKNEDGELIESGEYKFDSNGANKATENLAKHLGFYERDNKQKQLQQAQINILPPSKD